MEEGGGWFQAGEPQLEDGSGLGPPCVLGFSRVASRPAVEALLSSVVEADMGSLEVLLEPFLIIWPWFFVAWSTMRRRLQLFGGER